MSFDWSDEMIFNKWMENIIYEKQIEMEEDDVDQDDNQTIDTLGQIEEDKKEQPTSVVSTMVPTNEMVTKESDITIVLTIHDDVNGETQAELSLQKLKPSPLQTNSLAKSFEEQQQ